MPGIEQAHGQPGWTRGAGGWDPGEADSSSEVKEPESPSGFRECLAVSSKASLASQASSMNPGGHLGCRHLGRGHLASAPRILAQGAQPGGRACHTLGKRGLGTFSLGTLGTVGTALFLKRESIPTSLRCSGNPVATPGGEPLDSQGRRYPKD